MSSNGWEAKRAERFWRYGGDDRRGSPILWTRKCADCRFLTIAPCAVCAAQSD